MWTIFRRIFRPRLRWPRRAQHFLGSWETNGVWQGHCIAWRTRRIPSSIISRGASLVLGHHCPNWNPRRETTTRRSGLYMRNALRCTEKLVIDGARPRPYWTWVLRRLYLVTGSPDAGTLMSLWKSRIRSTTEAQLHIV